MYEDTAGVGLKPQPLPGEEDALQLGDDMNLEEGAGEVGAWPTAHELLLAVPPVAIERVHCAFVSTYGVARPMRRGGIVASFCGKAWCTSVVCANAVREQDEEDKAGEEDNAAAEEDDPLDAEDGGFADPLDAEDPGAVPARSHRRLLLCVRAPVCATVPPSRQWTQGALLTMRPPPPRCLHFPIWGVVAWLCVGLRPVR
jgi:hypothetical protein